MTNSTLVRLVYGCRFARLISAEAHMAMRLRSTIFAFAALFLFFAPSAVDAAPPIQQRSATRANLDYDIVYVRCPRAREPALISTSSGEFEVLNWGGVNDIWIEATNNVLHQPGCDLVLLRPDKSEEVLVDCDEDAAGPVCSVVDPNVSFDGLSIVYAKFSNTLIFGEGRNSASYVALSETPNEDGRYAVGHESWPMRAPAPQYPVLLYTYDLVAGVETQLSPDEGLWAGTVHGDGPEWTAQVAVMDLGPYYMPDGRIGFTSNRDSNWSSFHLFAMDPDGRNLERIGHRAMGQQLHPLVLMDGRILYTSQESQLQRTGNNNFSLFTVNPDGADPFIVHGQHDATKFAYHFTTQLSNGDIAVDAYYDENNNGMGTIHVFPIDPPGADFTHMRQSGNGTLEDLVPWDPGPGPHFDGPPGNSLEPFWRPGLYRATRFSGSSDVQTSLLAPESQWTHPDDGRTVVNGGKVGHPAAAPNNDLIVTYSIGGSSRVITGPDNDAGLEALQMQLGFDGGIWIVPGGGPIDSPTELELVVDRLEFHEIMARAVVPYSEIYGIEQPNVIPRTPNTLTDARSVAGEPFGFSGASSMLERETESLNGMAWNVNDGGGVHSGRNYMGLVVQGGDVAFYEDEEIYGIRAVMPQLPRNSDQPRDSQSNYAGLQRHPLRILGEWPVRRVDDTGQPVIDQVGNPDTSFLTKLPADTPFFFQAIDARGMALSFEMTGRSLAAGETQTCSGCHLHTREGIPFEDTPAYTSPDFIDFSGDSAPIVFENEGGQAEIMSARDLFAGVVEGVDERISFGADWSDVGPVLENRCGQSGCHDPGTSAGGLALDASSATFEALVRARKNACCTASRWVGMNSARSSMLVWAMYNARLDGRPNDTVLDPSNEIWDVDHPAIPGLLPVERQLIQKWIDLGAQGVPPDERTDDTRPVLTITPVLEPDESVVRVLVGLWDDSGIDYTSLRVVMNEATGGIDAGANLVSPFTGTPNVIEVVLPEPVTISSPPTLEFTFEVFDLAWPTFEGRGNRTRTRVTALGLLARAGLEVEGEDGTTTGGADDGTGSGDSAEGGATDGDSAGLGTGPTTGGSAGGSDGGGGCGCRSDASPDLSWWALLWAGVLVPLRRRRTAHPTKVLSWVARLVTAGLLVVGCGNGAPATGAGTGSAGTGDNGDPSGPVVPDSSATATVGSGSGSASTDSSSATSVTAGTNSATTGAGPEIPGCLGDVLTSMPEDSWTELPSTTLQAVQATDEEFPGIWAGNFQSSEGLFLWSGGAFDESSSRFLLWGGGHNAYYGNEVYAFDMNTCQWERLTDPSPPTTPDICTALLSDGRPNTRHTYYNLSYVSSLDSMFSTPAGTTSCFASGIDSNTWLFDQKTREWTNLEPSVATNNDQPPGWAPTESAYDAARDRVYMVSPEGLHVYDVAANTWTRRQGTARWGDRGAVVDPVRDLLVVVGNGELVTYDLADGSYATQVWEPANSDFNQEGYRPGVNYDPVADRIVVWDGGAVQILSLDTMAWTPGAVSPQESYEKGTYGRFRYSALHNAYIAVNNYNLDVAIYKHMNAVR